MNGTGASSRGQVKPRKQFERQGLPVKACIKCGAIWTKIHYCKAGREICKRCGKIGHFTAYCLFMRGSPKPNARATNNNTTNDRSTSAASGSQLRQSVFNNKNNRYVNRNNAHGIQNVGNQREDLARTEGPQELYARTIENYSRLIKLCPKDPQNYNNRSVCYMMAKQYDNAVTDASKVIALNSSCVESYCRLIKCAILLGYTMEAAVHLKKLEQIDPDHQTLAIEREKLSELQGLISRKHEAVRSANYKEALESVCACLLISSENWSLKLKQAEYLALLKRYAESERVIEEILERDRTNVMAKYIGGIKVYDMDIDAAVKYFEDVLNDDPRNSKARDLYEKSRRISDRKKRGNDEFVKKNFEAAHKLYSSALAIEA